MAKIELSRKISPQKGLGFDSLAVLPCLNGARYKNAGYDDGLRWVWMAFKTVVSSQQTCLDVTLSSKRWCCRLLSLVCHLQYQCEERVKEEKKRKGEQRPSIGSSLR